MTRIDTFALKSALVIAAAVFLCASSCSEDAKGFARASRITSKGQLIGGPHASGNVGDFLLFNSKIRVIISDYDHSAGSGSLWGGNIIDADLVRGGWDSPAGAGNDQFGEMYPMFNANPAMPSPDSSAHWNYHPVYVLNDGEKDQPPYGRAAVVRVVGRHNAEKNALFWFLGILNMMLSPQVDYVITDYVLEPDVNYVRMVTTLCSAGFCWGEDTDDPRYAPPARLIPNLRRGSSLFDQLVNGYVPERRVRGNDLGTSAGSNEVYAAYTDFTAAGVAPGDLLVIASGADKGRYSIIEVADGGQGLVLDKKMTSTAGGILFRVLAIKAQGSDLILAAGSNEASSASANFEDLGVRKNDLIEITSGASAGRYTVQEVEGGTLTLSAKMQADETGVSFIVEGIGESGSVLGDILLFGKEVALFGSYDISRTRWNDGLGVGIGFDNQLALQQIYLGGESTFDRPVVVDFIAGIGKGVSYAYFIRDGYLSLPLFTEFLTFAISTDTDFQASIKPDNPVSFERYLAVGEGDAGSLLDTIYKMRGARLGRVEGRLLSAGTMKPVSGVRVLVFRNLWNAAGALSPDPELLDQLGAPINEWVTDRGLDSLPDGSFGGYLQAQEDFTDANGNGRRDEGEDFIDANGNGIYDDGKYLIAAEGPGQQVSSLYPVSVAEGKTVAQTILLQDAGTVTFEVRDAYDRPVPCKVTFAGKDRAGRPKPYYGDSYLDAGISKVVFSPDGRGEVAIEEGAYDVWVTGGPEYSIFKTEVEVVRGQTAFFTGRIAREVDTTGFAAANFHEHTRNSIDSGLSFEKALAANMAEGLEFFAVTDHDMITDLKYTALENGFQDRISSTPGEELSTFELGHFNGFPLRYERERESNGAVKWIRFKEFKNGTLQIEHLMPAEIFDGLHEQGAWGDDTVVTVNHPLGGESSYFSIFGLDILTGEVKGGSILAGLPPGNPVFKHPVVQPENFSWRFDAIEIFNGKRMDLYRIPMQREVDAFPNLTLYEVLARTVDEQADIIERGRAALGKFPGTIDAWFTLLNLPMKPEGGRRWGKWTAFGATDAHGTTGVERGCPLTYVASSTDMPQAMDEREIARNLKNHKAFVTYGPMIDFYVNEPGNGIGSTVTLEGGALDLHIKVQSPTWFDVDRVEVYENGILITEITADGCNALPPAGGIEVEAACDAGLRFDGLRRPNTKSVNFDGVVRRTNLDKDAWYVVAALGNDDMTPLFVRVERPWFLLMDVVLNTFKEIGLEDWTLGFPFPELSAQPEFFKTVPVVPYGITNPIWVDVDGRDADGDGDAFDAAGSMIR